jgi:hypothetical protein
MQQIYSVKLRNVTKTASVKKQFRASYFPYDRFYLVHRDDYAAGLADRMFFVYLFHEVTPGIQQYMDEHIDIVNITTLGSKGLKVTKENKIKDTSQSRVAWHVKGIHDYVIIVPTYTHKYSKSTRETAENSVGYASAKSYIHAIDDEIGPPSLVVNGENLKQPCVFCDQYFDGFQSGLCRFGDIKCHKTCVLYLPEKRLEIKIGDVECQDSNQPVS